MRFVVILLSVVLLSSCGGPPAQPQMPPPVVGVANPILRELPLERVLSGRIEATETVEISPQVSGQVLKVLAADGAELKVGDPILEIDPAPFLAALARADAGVAQAAANLRLATDARERNAKLVKTGIVQQQAYDDSITAAVAAEAALAAAKAALTTAQLDRTNTVVRAPISGRLGIVRTTTGNVVQGGGGFPPSVITTLVALDPVHALIDLDETTYRVIAERLAASVAGGAPVRVRVGVAGEVGFPHEGRVSVIDNHVDAGTGSIRLRATIANPRRVLIPGAFARIAIEVAPARPVLLVHEQALLSQLVTRYVLTVDAKGITAFRPVQPGTAHGVLREVSGLAPTDRVVATNLAKIFFPGMPVLPEPVDMETLQKPADAPAGNPAAPAGPASSANTAAPASAPAQK